MAKKKRICILTATAALLTALGFFLAYNRTFQAQREDFQRISSQKYDTVFLSMYPLDYYAEEDYSYYRAMDILKASYCFPKVSKFRQYMNQIEKSQNQVHTVYLGIRPDLINAKDLVSFIALWPDRNFEVILSYPSADYWRSLSAHSYESALAKYTELLLAAPTVPNAGFYFIGSQEWLIANPANYETEFTANPSVTKTIMLNSDCNHQYLVTESNAQSFADSLANLTADLRAGREYPDLSEYCVVFWGDSVIGSYNDSASIPGVFSGLTGATVFNCGYGGNSAAMGSEQQITLPGIADAFFAGDLTVLPEREQVYAGTADYLKQSPAAKKNCYVISYGLNDYFNGYPISSADPYDTATYSGALRTSVDTIRANDPEARIVLCTPNRIGLFESGTEPHGVSGNVLEDYADAVIDLADELKTDVLDNYTMLGITPENWAQYLEDGVHPNSSCRFLFANNLIDLFR